MQRLQGVTNDDAEDRFSTCYRSHSDRVMVYALRHVAPHEAEEVVAETFTAVWRSMDKLPDEPLPWLLTIARNKITDLRRRKGRRPETLDDGARLTRLASQRDSPEAIVVDRTTLIAALADLPEQQREALLLVSWDGLTVAQAAQVTGVSRVTFSSRLHRARLALSASLVDDEEDAPVAVATTQPVLKGIS